MAITNGYATLAEVKAALRVTDAVDDALIENAIEGASRRIDGYCGRFFYQSAQTIDLFPNTEYSVGIPDLASSTITLRTDTAGDGTFATTWSASDYYLEPLNQVFQSRPYNRITAKGSKTFPFLYQPPRPTIRLTGTFGWSAIPDDVREACILLSLRGFARLNAALGVVGFADMAITVRAIDPDVRDLLAPYRIIGIF